MKRRPLEGSLLELEAEAEGTGSEFRPVIFLCFVTFYVFVVCRNRLLDELFSVMLDEKYILRGLWSRVGNSALYEVLQRSC